MVFGNLFSHRSDSTTDFSKGLFYSGRVRLFGKENKVHPTAPSLIRTISIIKPKEYEKEMERSITDTDISRTKSMSNILKIQPKPKPKEEASHHHHHQPQPPKIKKTDTFIINTPDKAWKVEEFGGVKMWVNQVTGDVSVNNPNEQKEQQKQQVQIREPVKKVMWREAVRRYSLLLVRSSSISSMKSNKKRTSVFLSEDKEVQEAFDLLDPKSALKMSVLTEELGYSKSKLSIS
eukprot:gene2668-2834_t